MMRELEKKIESLLDEASNSVMIGRFVNDSSAMINAGATTMKFEVERLCDNPWVVDDIDYNYQLFPQDDIYMCIAKNNSNHEKNSFPLYYNEYDSYEEKQRMLNHYYKDSLVIFHPVYEKSSITNNYFRNVELLHVLPIGIQEVPKNYLCIPKIKMKIEELESILLKQEYFSIDEYPSTIYDSVDFIECKGFIFEVSLASHEQDEYLWKNTNEKINKMGLKKGAHVLRVIQNDEYFSFIDESYIQELQMDATEVGLQKQVESVLEEVEVDKEEVEDLLLQSFVYHAKKRQLCYRKLDLVNFHVAMKSAPLVIVAGMSGTGKTRITFEYARVMNMGESTKTLLVLPISPAYNEPSDITGYYNSVQECYVPAEGGLVDLLLHAQKYEDQMHMVVFDEMNLAQIEHYFAQFLSLMELDQKYQKLHLYNENLVCQNKEEYPASIQLKGNVLFVGTVNMDETTNTISDRLLDRSLVVHLEKQSFLDYFEEQQSHEEGIDYVVGSSKEYQRLCTTYSIQELDIHFIKFMDEVHQLLNKYDAQKGVSFRALKNMGTYVNNMPTHVDNIAIGRWWTYDMAFKQSVVSKIIGDQKSLEKVLGTNNERGELFELLERYKDLSDFKESIRELVIKKQNLVNYGYTNK